MSLLRRYATGCCLILAVSLARAEGAGDSAQRGAWQHLTPEERQQVWRGMSREQKGEVIRSLSPEQREALRQRLERRIDQDDPGRRGDAVGPRRLTPEQRQQLREQINAANRDWRERPRPVPGAAGEPPRERR